MSYMALYRKWRPDSFSDVKGQDHIVTTLKNQIEADRIGHAYLFCGTRGTGKTTVAKIFAKTVNCALPAFLPVLAMYLKDVLVSRCAPGAELVFRQSILQNKTVFDKIDINTLYDGVSECEKAMKLLEGNVSSMLITATLAIRLGGTRID